VCFPTSCPSYWGNQDEYLAPPRSCIIDGSLIHDAYAAHRKRKLQNEFSLNCPSPRSPLPVIRHTIGARTCPKALNPGDREDQDGARGRVSAWSAWTMSCTAGDGCASSLRLSKLYGRHVNEQPRDILTEAQDNDIICRNAPCPDRSPRIKHDSALLGCATMWQVTKRFTTRSRDSMHPQFHGLCLHCSHTYIRSR
jgi:hypothetical protein